jgi:hypothetical protein
VKSNPKALHAPYIPLRVARDTLRHGTGGQRCVYMLVFLLGNFFSISQPFQQWVATHNGTAGSIDYGRALSTDAAGNVFIAGTATNTGTFKDITVVKYDPQGVKLWIATYNGAAGLDDWCYGLATDTSGNVYAAGFTSTTTSGKDFVTVKFDPSGSFQWARQYNGPGNQDDAANHISADPSGNIVVTGISKGNGTLDDYATIKYAPDGTQLWVARYDGPAGGVDDARTVATDDLGNVYVSGGSTGAGTGYDFATIKYDSQGAQQWVARYNGPGNGYDLVYYQGSVVADSLGNVYITGYSTGQDSSLDYATVKYDSLGNPLWVARFSTEINGTEYANALHVDKSLNVYVTGGSYTTAGNYNFATLKYDGQGVLQWTAYYNGTASDWDEAYGVVTDDSLNVYVTGRSPGIGTMADFVTLKYTSSGSPVWEARYAGTGYDWPFSIRLLKDGCIYVGGNIGTSSVSDMGIVKYCQAPAGIGSPVHTNPAIDIYPNPTSGVVTLVIPEGSKKIFIEIFSMSGNRVYHNYLNPGRHAISIDTSPGIYFVRYADGAVLNHAKLVVLAQNKHLK